MDQDAEHREAREDLREADKGGILIQHRDHAEVHERRIVARGVHDDLHRGVEQHEEPGGIARARAAALHPAPPLFMEKAQHHDRHGEHQQKRDEEGRHAVGDVPGRVAQAGGEGQELQPFRAHDDAAAAGGVEERAEADEGDQQRHAGGRRIQQLTHGRRQVELPADPCGEPDPEQHPGQAEAAVVIVGERVEQGGIGLGVEVPVQEAAEEQAEHEAQHRKAQGCRHAPMVLAIEEERHHRAQEQPQCDDRGARVDRIAAYFKQDQVVHPIAPPSSGSAVAKYRMSLTWRSLLKSM